ncbi:hypothetical protein HUG10_11585 [Halorarum halophilum]|uniref:Nucleotidyltransferase n=1 Tax=Halorarum halophilum TaxID=2743090 RepID=A0A7D5GG14_9EURY|nr:hypothetical protein [Halobaculum halophilum]QLG28150.1 hypothetical protein HUG10_11585 [Halobaculum halophilum]
MALSASQEAVLNELVVNIPNSVSWCMFGSTDSVLRGLDDDPADIDVLTTESGAKRFRAVFSDEFVGTHEIGVSQIDEYRVHDEELEVLFSKREREHQEPLVDLGAVELEATADRGIPLLPLKPLVEAYRKIDKHDTADRLEDEFDLTDG